MAERALPPMGSNAEVTRRGPDVAAVGLAAVLLFLDQASKFLVTYRLALPEERVIPLLPFFDLRWEENRGVSLNFLTAGNETERWLLVAFTGLICAGVAAWLWRERKRGTALALGAVLGGALGNIADRVNHAFVVDFADLHFGEWRPFQIFNLADVAISLGVLALLATSLFGGARRRG